MLFSIVKLLLSKGNKFKYFADFYYIQIKFYYVNMWGENRNDKKLIICNNVLLYRFL